MAAKPSLLDSTGSHNWQEGYFHQKVNVKTRECQNPYNHNPYCVEILIGFLEFLIGTDGTIFFGSFGCRDFDLSVGIMIDRV